MHARSLFKTAFLEYKVTRQMSTGNGELYAGHVTLPGESDVPGGFIRNELGHDGPIGIRLQVMIPQGELEARHRARCDVAAPNVRASKRKPKRETKWSRRARLEQLQAQALAMRVAA